MITWENYEEYMMLYADGELTAEWEAALIAFTDQHPELKKELSLYAATRLTLDVNEVYAGKDALMKPVPAARVVAIPVWLKYGIAAGIVALLFIPFFARHSSDDGRVALKDTVRHTRPAFTTTGVTAVAANNTTTVHDSAATVSVVKNIPPPRVHEKKQTALAATDKKVNKIAPRVESVSPAVQENDPIDRLPVASAQKLPAVSNSVPAASRVDEPAYAIAMVNEEPAAKKTFWDKLPIKESGKRELEQIASTISGTYDQVNDVKTDIKNTKLIVRVEKKRLMISF